MIDYVKGIQVCFNLLTMIIKVQQQLIIILENINLISSYKLTGFLGEGSELSERST